MLTPAQITQALATRTPSPTSTGGAPLPGAAMTPEQAQAWITGSTQAPTAPTSTNIGQDTAAIQTQLANQAVSQVQAGAQKFQSAGNIFDKNPVTAAKNLGQKTEGLLGAAIHPVGDVAAGAFAGIGAVANKAVQTASDNPFVQKYAQLPGVSGNLDAWQKVADNYNKLAATNPEKAQYANDAVNILMLLAGGEVGKPITKAAPPGGERIAGLNGTPTPTPPRTLSAPTPAEAFKGMASDYAQGAKNTVQGIKAAPQAASDLYNAITAKSPKAMDAYLKAQYQKGVRPTVVGKSTNSQTGRSLNRAVQAVDAIVENKPNLNITDKNGEPTGKVPQTLNQFSQAIEQTRKAVFNEYDAMQRKSGEGGAKVDLAPIARDLTTVTNNPVLNDLHPEVINYATQRAETLTNRKAYTTTQAQEAIANLNDSLETYYKNPSYDAASRAAVDALIANRLRASLDSVITNTHGEGYQALKNKYGALRGIEKDVVHRAIVDGRKNNIGLSESLINAGSASELVRGLMSMNPAHMAADLGQGFVLRGVARFNKWRNDPNTAIKRLFAAAEQKAKRGLATPGTESTPPLPNTTPLGPLEGPQKGLPGQAPEAPTVPPKSGKLSRSSAQNSTSPKKGKGIRNLPNQQGGFFKNPFYKEPKAEAAPDATPNKVTDKGGYWEVARENGSPYRISKKLAPTAHEASQAAAHSFATKPDVAAKSTPTNTEDYRNEPIFMGHPDLTTALLDQLKGKRTTTIGELKGIVNSGKLRTSNPGAELAVMQEFLDKFGENAKIPVKQLADFVMKDRLVLTPKNMPRLNHSSTTLQARGYDMPGAYGERTYDAPEAIPGNNPHFGTKATVGHLRGNVDPGEQIGSLISDPRVEIAEQIANGKVPRYEIVQGNGKDYNTGYAATDHFYVRDNTTGDIANPGNGWGYRNSADRAVRDDGGFYARGGSELTKVTPDDLDKGTPLGDTYTAPIEDVPRAGGTYTAQEAQADLTKSTGENPSVIGQLINNLKNSALTTNGRGQDFLSNLSTTITQQARELHRLAPNHEPSPENLAATAEQVIEWHSLNREDALTLGRALARVGDNNLSTEDIAQVRLIRAIHDQLTDMPRQVDESKPFKLPPELVDYEHLDGDKMNFRMIREDIQQRARQGLAAYRLPTGATASAAQGHFVPEDLNRGYTGKTVKTGDSFQANDRTYYVKRVGQDGTVTAVSGGGLRIHSDVKSYIQQNIYSKHQGLWEYPDSYVGTWERMLANDKAMKEDVGTKNAATIKKLITDYSKKQTARFAQRDKMYLLERGSPARAAADKKYTELGDIMSKADNALTNFTQNLPKEQRDSIATRAWMEANPTFKGNLRTMTDKEFVKAYNAALGTHVKIFNDGNVANTKGASEYTFKNGTPPSRGTNAITIPPDTIANMSGRSRGVYYFYEERLAKWIQKMYPDAHQVVDKNGFGWWEIPLHDKKGPVYTFGALPFVAAGLGTAAAVSNREQ